MNKNESLNPQIYVACLASYNAGTLYGAWINANQDPESILEAIHDMLANSPVDGAQEWAVHDYDDFGELDLCKENPNLAQLSETAQFLAEHGELGALVLGEFSDISTAQCVISESYCGEYESEADYAESIYTECWDIPEHLQGYIDYKKLARDIFGNDCFSIPHQGKVHVFSNF